MVDGILVDLNFMRVLALKLVPCRLLYCKGSPTLHLLKTIYLESGMVLTLWYCLVLKAS